PGHELVVREPVRPRGRVDPQDPEPPEGALPRLAVAVGVRERVVDLLLGVAVARLLEPPVALRLLEDPAALLARVDGALDPRHGSAPPEQPLHGADVALRDRMLLAEAPLTLRRLLLELVARH